MLGKWENRNYLPRTKNNNVYLIIAIVSLVFIYGISISAGVSNAQVRTSSTPLPVPNKSSNITITSNSNSVYSIPSTSVQVDRFSTNYTIAGKISSLNYSRNLITSTIVDDFDKNPNIGYVINNSSSGSQTSSTAPIPPPQPGIPNPFVSEDMINKKITKELQGAIAAAAVSPNIPEKHVEVKCTFGMILSDYKCS